MRVVPVLDIRDGLAVRAVAGLRDDYKPLKTPLAASSDPIDVVDGFMALWPFQTLYIADLDAIEGRGRNPETIAAIARAHQRCEIWVDDGSVTVDQFGPHLKQRNITMVVGSESLADSDQLGALNAALPERLIVSLDFKGNIFAGPPAILETADAWPARVIAMTLSAVGACEGPDLDAVRDIKARACPSCEVYAAGGVRNLQDINAAREAGAAGALIASALHAQTIKAGDLDEITGL